MRIAVPDLARYTFQSGIGRVFCSLAEHWQNQGIYLTDARLRAHLLPPFRNIPYAVEVPVDTDLVLLPKMTGATALKQTQGRPSLAIVHDIGIIDCPADANTINPVANWSIRRSFYGLRHADHIVTVSQFTRQALLRHLPELAERSSVIASGVSETFLNHQNDSEVSLDRLKPAIGIASRGPILLYVGSELPRKNITTLLEAFAILKTCYPDAALLKVGRAGGERWRKQTLNTMERLRLRARRDVFILEDINDTQLADAYATSDIFVTTSLYEGFGLPALEALAVGTPVVVSDQGSLPEIVGDVGTIVEPTPERVAEALTSVLATTPTPEKVVAFKKHAAGYGWARAAHAYHKQIKTLVHHRR